MRSRRSAFLWHFGSIHGLGGRAVAHDLLAGLAADGDMHRHVCIVDKRLVAGMRVPAPKDVVELDLSAVDRRVAADQFIVPRIARSSGARALISLGNSGPWLSPIPHGVFIQTAYLAYPRRELRGVARSAESHRLALGSYFLPVRATATSFAVQTVAMQERFCSRWRLPRERVRIIRGSLSNDFVSALAQAGSAQPDHLPLFVTASREGAHKNIAIIPSVAQALARRGVPARFAIALEEHSDWGRRMRAAAVTLGVGDRVDLVGTLDSLQLAKLLRRATGAFLPSLLESFGLPYLEAQAAGVAVVAADRPFAREACGDGAEYFDPLDADAAAAAVQRALATVSSRAKRYPSPQLLRTSSDVCADFVSWASELARIEC